MGVRLGLEDTLRAKRSALKKIGTMKKSFLLGALALISLGAMTAAMAADLPARPYTKAPEMMMPALYDWSGVYIGVNGGWGTSHRCFDQTGPTIIGPDGCHNTDGGFAGGQAGYRWQMSSWVFGFDLQGDWADLKGSNVSVLNSPNVNRSHIDDFGLFTGQVGYAWNTALLYFKGGAAVVADRNEIRSTNGTVLASSSGENRWGGTVGAGIEFSFAPNWSAAFEYNHLFIPSNNTNMITPAGTLLTSDRIHGDADLVSVRVNYRWGGPVVAKY
jgi:outer membrane immunogenic protein